MDDTFAAQPRDPVIEAIRTQRVAALLHEEAKRKAEEALEAEHLTERRLRQLEQLVLNTQPKSPAGAAALVTFLFSYLEDTDVAADVFPALASIKSILEGGIELSDGEL
jgi:hypothetical protein